MPSHTVYLVFLFCLAALGCGQSDPLGELMPSELNRTVARDSAEIGGQGGLATFTASFDLGDIVSDNQEIKHSFSIVNKGDRVIYLTDAVALVPCCSAIEPLSARSLSPGGEAVVKVTYRPGLNEGNKTVGFLIATDFPATPTLRLSLAATLHPAWTAKTTATKRLSGQEEREEIEFQIATNSPAGKDNPLPESWSIDGPARIESLGPPMEKMVGGSVTQQSRRFKILALSDATKGLHRASLTFRWSNGDSKRAEVRWMVDPAVVVVPSGLVLMRSGEATTQKLVIRSSKRSFQVIEVVGELLAEPVEFSPEAATTHPLSLQIKPIPPDLVSSVLRIKTDQPDQPEILVNLLVVGKSLEGHP